MAERVVRRLALLALLAASAISASALTVGIAPAEGKAYAPPPEGPGSPLGYLVSGCLSALFDAGFIATDAAASRIPREAWGPSDYALAEAKDGLVDYIIALYVDWAASSFHKGTSLPVSVEYRLVRVRDGEVIAEGSIRGLPDSEDSSSHEARTASQAGGSVVGDCSKTLSTLAMGGEK